MTPCRVKRRTLGQVMKHPSHYTCWLYKRDSTTPNQSRMILVEWLIFVPRLKHYTIENNDFMVFFTIWRFPKIGGPPVLIHSIFGFSLLLVAPQETSQKPSGGKNKNRRLEKKQKKSFVAVFLLKNLHFLQGFSIAMFDQQRI